MNRKLSGGERHLQAAKRQGLSVAEYARRNGLSAWSLYSARRDEARRNQSEANGLRSGAFAAVEVIGAVATMQAQLPNGVAVNFSGSDIAGFLTALAGLPCSR